jgi:transposase
MNLTEKFKLIDLDKQQWQRLYYRNQQGYIRQRLSAIRYQRMILEERPKKYEIDREIWTGKIIATVINQKWGVELKTSRIYEILDELNLSHQKAHRDYANADPHKQKEFVEILKKTGIEKEWRENPVF